MYMHVTVTFLSSFFFFRSHTPQNNSDEEMESQDTGSVSVENPSNVDPEENLSESFVSAQGNF